MLARVAVSVLLAVGWVGSLAGPVASAGSSGWINVRNVDVPGAYITVPVAVDCAEPGWCVVVGYSVAPVTGARRPMASLMVDTLLGPRLQQLAVPVPEGAAAAALVEVACTAARVCVGVGTTSDVNGITHAFAGTVSGAAGGSWSPFPVAEPVAAVSSALVAVDCARTDRCVAVGNFHAQPDPNLPHAFVGAVSLAGAQGVWASVTGAEDPPLGSSELRDVSCGGADACVAVGYATPVPSLLVGSVSDTTFSPIPATGVLQNPSGITLDAVACSSATDCVAGGTVYFGGSSIAGIAVTAAGWSALSGFGAGPHPDFSWFVDAACTGTGCVVSYSLPTVVSLGGGGSVAIPHAVLATVAGASVVPIPGVEPPGARSSLVGSLSCADTRHCTGVGYWVDAGGAQRALVGTLDPVARTWTPVDVTPPHGPPSSLDAVACPAPEACTAVGTSIDVGTKTCAWIATQPTHAPPAPAVPVVPQRLVDTRILLGAPGGRLAAQATLAVQVTGVGGAAVPADASSAYLNVTVDAPAHDGFVTVWPCGSPMPTASNLNFRAGETIANLAVTKIGGDGQVCMYASAPTDLVVDLNAWQPSVSPLTSLVPQRLVDTRIPLGAPNGRLLANSVLTVEAAAVSGIAPDATTMYLNVTVNAPARDGYLTVWPCPAPMPTSSNLNFRAGQTIANLAIAGVGSSGLVCIYASAPTDLVVDIGAWEPAR